MLKYTRAWKIERFLDRLFPPGMIYFLEEFLALKTTAYIMKALAFEALCTFEIELAMLNYAMILESSYENRRRFNSSVAVNESSYWSKSFFLWFISDSESILLRCSFLELEISRIILDTSYDNKKFVPVIFACMYISFIYPNLKEINLNNFKYVFFSTFDVYFWRV